MSQSHGWSFRKRKKQHLQFIYTNVYTDRYTIKRNTHCNRNMIIVHVTLGTVHVSHRMLFSWLQIMTNTHSDLSQKGSGKHLTSAPGPCSVGTKRKQSEFVQKTRCKMFFFYECDPAVIFSCAALCPATKPPRPVFQNT